MKKFEARTLEEAYRIACDEFGCSMSALQYEIVQYPSKGILGLFAKPAIIVAVARESRSDETSVEKKRTPSGTKSQETAIDMKNAVENNGASKSSAETPERSHEEIIDRFFDESGREKSAEEANAPALPDEQTLQREIEAELKSLMERSCFDIDVVEVDVIDNTAYIFMDGDDAALLIGKEGYRYNALSYLLFNWLHSRYDLYIKLEIAQFLSTQQEMIRHTLQPVIEHVEREGWGRTRPLDGILVQIALEQLREAFPNKYVAIKRQRDGSRYVLINEFNNRRR